MVARCRWSYEKSKALVAEIDTNYRILFPNDGDGPSLAERVAQKWLDITENINKTYTLVHHSIKQVQEKWGNLKRDARSYNTAKQNDMVRISGGGAREVPDDELFEKVLAVISTYEQEAQTGIGEGGEATGGLARRHTITPAAARGRRRRTPHATPATEAEDPELKQAKLRKLDLQAQLFEQQLANAQKEGDILAAKAAILSGGRCS